MPAKPGVKSPYLGVFGIHVHTRGRLLSFGLVSGLIYVRATFDSHSTAIRPRYDHSTTYVTTVQAAALRTNQAVREVATICPPPPLRKLTFDLLTLNVVPESRVMSPTSVPILDFLGLSVLDLGPMYATDRQTSDAHHRLMPPPYGAGA